MTTSSRSAVNDLAYIAVFAALIIVLAFVSIPVASGVPIVLQNAAVILAGLILGHYRGLLATALFLGLGMLGMPVLAGGRSTIAAIAGPSVGYLVGYLFAAFIAGYFAYRTHRVFGVIAGGVLGLAAQYFCGIIGLVLRAHMTFPQALAAQTPFLLFDAIKIAAVIIIALSVHSALPFIRRLTY